MSKSSPFQSKKVDIDPKKKSSSRSTPSNQSSSRPFPSLPALSPLGVDHIQDENKTIVERPQIVQSIHADTRPFSSPIPSYVAPPSSAKEKESFIAFDQTEALESPFSKISTQPDPPPFLIPPPSSTSPITAENTPITAVETFPGGSFNKL